MDYLNKLFKNKDGKVVIWQFPNAPLLVAIAAWLLRHFTEGTLHTIGDGVFFGAILVWAGLEVFSGVNYFRRGLGLLVAALVISSRF